MINNIPSKAYTAVFDATAHLIEKVEAGIKLLHWNDFEILVDLLFRAAGWKRVSVLGENMKYTDLELLEPITEYMYQVQIKSESTLNEFIKYADEFPEKIFEKLYFIVHSPDENLEKYENKRSNVELIFTKRLAKMVVDFGLTEWLLKKIK